MSAFDQYPLRPQRMQGFGRRTLRLGVDYLDIYQQARLVKVGGQQRRQREQLTAKRIQGRRCQQRVSVHGCAYRVDDERNGQLEPTPGRGHGRNDARRGQHPGLGGLNADVGDDRLDLAGHHIVGNFMNILDSQRVLYGNRRDCDARVHS
ncbi:Uncharacterised protein [Mycobacterium tuberculosis]|nr:Uncharacterised protein [Mycobacterium tuberculosis]